MKKKHTFDYELEIFRLNFFAILNEKSLALEENKPLENLIKPKDTLINNQFQKISNDIIALFTVYDISYNKLQLNVNELKSINSSAKSLNKTQYIFDTSHPEHAFHLKKNFEVIKESPNAKNLQNLIEIYELFATKMKTLQNVEKKIFFELKNIKHKNQLLPEISKTKEEKRALSIAEIKKIEKDISHYENKIARLEKILSKTYDSSSENHKKITKQNIEKETKINPTYHSKSFYFVKSMNNNPTVIYKRVKNIIQDLAYNLPLGKPSIKPKFRNNVKYNLDHILNDKENAVPDLLKTLEEYTNFITLDSDTRYANCNYLIFRILSHDNNKRIEHYHPRTLNLGSAAGI